MLFALSCPPVILAHWTDIMAWKQYFIFEYQHLSVMILFFYFPFLYFFFFISLGVRHTRETCTVWNWLPMFGSWRRFNLSRLRVVRLQSCLAHHVFSQMPRGHSAGLFLRAHTIMLDVIFVPSFTGEGGFSIYLDLWNEHVHVSNAFGIELPYTQRQNCWSPSANV